MLLNYACRHVELGGASGANGDGGQWGANGDIHTCQWIVEELKQRGYRPNLTGHSDSTVLMARVIPFPAGLPGSQRQRDMSGLKSIARPWTLLQNTFS